MSDVIAVDPGASGAIAWSIRGNAEVQKMPDTRGDCISILRSLVEKAPFTAYIEKINGWIPDGGASQMFQFGCNVERVGAILETLGVRIIEVPPKTWQKALGLGGVGKEKVPQAPRGISKDEKKAWKAAHAEVIRAIKARNGAIIRDWKNKLKAEAQRRFPGISVTLANADALLLLDYARAQQ